LENEGTSFQGGFRKHAQQVCSYCGSGDLVTGLRVDQTADAGRIGLAYKAWKLLGGTERIHADLCRSCGTVARFYVKDPNKNWYLDKDLAQPDCQNRE